MKTLLLTLVVLGITVQPCHSIDFHIPLQTVFNNLGYSVDIYNDEIVGDVFFEVADSKAAIVDQQSAWERGSALGWYTDPSAVNWVVGGSLTGLPLQAQLPDIGQSFALSLWTAYWPGEGGNYQWYSESERNWDWADHVHVFQTRISGQLVPHSYLLAWEDMPNLGDADFQDMVVRIDGVQAVQGSSVPVAVPEPTTGTMVLIGVGMLLAATRVGGARHRCGA